MVVGFFFQYMILSFDLILFKKKKKLNDYKEKKWKKNV